MKEKTVNVQTDDSGAARVTREETSLTRTEIKDSSELMLSSGAPAESWRMFIVDSGASYNLIKRNCLTKAEQSTITKAMCISLQTANGIIYADEQADVVVHMLYETTMPFFVLDDTVNFVSLTYLVDEYCFDYCQNHGEAPYLQRKGQPRVYCKTSQNASYWNFYATQSGRSGTFLACRRTLRGCWWRCASNSGRTRGTVS